MSKDLVEWIISKQKEVEDAASVLSDQQTISFEQLNLKMAKYAGYFSWVVSEAAIASEAVKRERLAYETWYNEKHIAVKNSMPSGTTMKAIDAEMSLRYADEWQAWRRKLLELEEKESLRKQFVHVWASLKDIYVELARNLRADLNVSNLGGVNKSAGFGVYQDRRPNASQQLDRLKRMRGIKNESRENSTAS